VAERSLMVMVWLSEPWVGATPLDDDRPAHLPEQPSRLQVYAALVAMDTGGYGFIYGGAGRYGREGLHQDEAIALLRIREFINGWLVGTGGGEVEAFNAAVDAEWARVDALNAEEPVAMVDT